jgi:carbon monoxide dehydrogenase subunit G
MASIGKEVHLNAPSEAVWDAVRDVGALHTRPVPDFVTDSELGNGARIVTFANGMIVRELIVAIDDERRRVVWSAVGAPMTQHNGSFRVLDDGPGGTHGVWIADALPNEMVPTL